MHLEPPKYISSASIWNRFLSLLLASIALTTVTGCGHSSGTSPAAVGPGAGSTFVFQYYQIDSTGRVLSAIGHDTETVTATGLSYHGKANVFTTSCGFGAPEYCHIEANGDFSFYRTGDLDERLEGWKTIPLSSKGVLTYRVQDLNNPGKIPVEHTISFANAGKKTLTLANHTFETIRMAVTDTRQGSTASKNSTCYYVPELGIEIEDTLQAGRDFDGIYQYANVRNLVAYTLK